MRFTSVSDFVTIVCLEHGAFVQKARAHYAGNGCPRCGRMRKSMIAIYQEEFVQEAQVVHGKKYDYSRVKFKSKRNSERIEIVCPDHGVFLQNPMNHLRGSGCRECAGNAPGTTSSFIEAAREVHGAKYDYDNVIYISSTFPVRITCREHGDFAMAPSMHLTGRGCRRCADERRTELSRATTEEFIAAARRVHEMCSTIPRQCTSITMKKLRSNVTPMAHSISCQEAICRGSDVLVVLRRKERREFVRCCKS